MTLSILTVLWNHHHFPFPDLFQPSKRQLCSHLTIIPYSPLPPAPATSRNVPIPGASGKWSHTTPDLLCLTF